MLYIKKILFDVLYPRRSGAVQGQRYSDLKVKDFAFGLKSLVSVTLRTVRNAG
jgi:hypothetical protein